MNGKENIRIMVNYTMIKSANNYGKYISLDIFAHRLRWYNYVTVVFRNLDL